MAKETENEAFITLNFSGIEKKFADIYELKEFVKSQRRAWAWLEQAAAKNGNLVEVWNIFRRYFMRIRQFIGEYEMSLARSKLPINLINQFREQTKAAIDQGFILTGTPIALFAFGLKDRVSPEIAGYALAILNNIKVRINSDSAHEGEFWAGQYRQSLEPNSHEAQQMIQNLVELARANRLKELHSELEVKNEQLIKATKNLQGQSNLLTKKVADQAAKQSNDLESQMAEQAGDFKNQVATLVSNFKGQITRQTNNFKTQMGKRELEFEGQIVKQKDEFNDLYDATVKRFDTFEDLLNRALPYEKAMKFWKIKYKLHVANLKRARKLAVIIATATAVVFIVMSVLLFSTYSETLFGKPEGADLLMKDNLWKGSILLVITTLGFWLTRLATKIFICNQHLEMDCQERITIMYTYLALLVTKDALKDEERPIILETLFRASSSGLVKDDGPITIPDAFIKAMKRYSSKL